MLDTEKNMISIDGLTPKQQQLLTIMWSIPTTDDLEMWINSLDPEDAVQADVLSTLCIYEYCDQILEKSQDFTQAKEFLSKF